MTVLICSVASAIVAVIVVIFNGVICRLLGQPQFSPWLYVVPFSVLLMGVYYALYYWANRVRCYKEMARGKVGRALTLAVVSITLGTILHGPAGLILGVVAGQLFGVVYMAASAVLSGQLGFGNWQMGRWRAVAHRYREFPTCFAPASLLNVGASQIPVFLMTSFLGSTIVGFYTLTQRVLGVPTSIVGTAVADVLRERIAGEYRTVGNCRRTYRIAFLALVGAGFLPFLLLIVFGPRIFAFVFGEPWRTAGVYVRVLAPLYYLGLVANPLSVVLIVSERLRQNLVWQTCLFVTTITAVSIGCYSRNALTTIVLFAIVYGAMYAVYLGMSFRSSFRARCGKTVSD